MEEMPNVGLRTPDFSTHGAGGDSRPKCKCGQTWENHDYNKCDGELERIINRTPLPKEGEKWAYSQILACEMRNYIKNRLNIIIEQVLDKKTSPQAAYGMGWRACVEELKRWI